MWIGVGKLINSLATQVIKGDEKRTNKENKQTRFYEVRLKSFPISSESFHLHYESNTQVQDTLKYTTQVYTQSILRHIQLIDRKRDPNPNLDFVTFQSWLYGMCF